MIPVFKELTFVLSEHMGYPGAYSIFLRRMCIIVLLDGMFCTCLLGLFGVWKWKSLSCVRALCDPIDNTVHGILQARILEWVAIPFSRDLPKTGSEPRSPAVQADSLPTDLWGKPLVAQLVKNPPAMRETWVQSLSWEDLLKKGTATHSSILAWRIPWAVYSLGSPRVRLNWATFTFTSNRNNVYLGTKMRDSGN